jgi:hypothetical protein
MQLWVTPQPLKQEPQLAGSLSNAKQTRPFPGMAHAGPASHSQTPPRQVASLGHVMPQALQFPSSVCSSTQLSPPSSSGQSVVPAAHWQPASSQVWLTPQAGWQMTAAPVVLPLEVTPPELAALMPAEPAPVDDPPVVAPPELVAPLVVTWPAEPVNELIEAFGKVQAPSATIVAARMSHFMASNPMARSGTIPPL